MDVLVALIPMALGLALSPVPIIELILVLFSRRRVLNSIVFVAALLVFSAVGLAMGAAGTNATDSETNSPGTVTAVVFIVLGALLLAIGLINYRNRADTSEPPILATIGRMGPGPVAFLALGATIINPKNLPLLIGAGSVVAETGSSLLWSVGFLAVATSPYWAAALYAGLGGDRAQTRLDAMRAWLVGHNRLIMGIVCLLMGAVLALKGMAAL
jgi:uncharacterized membrane protein